MANTYTLISSSTVGAGGAATITFSSIPSTYTDLLVKVSARTTYATNADLGYIRFNSSTTGYSIKRLQGNGSIAYSAGGTEILFRNTGASDTASTFGNSELYIPNYTSSANKSVSVDSVSENNGTTAEALLGAGLWSNTAAITQITLYPNNGNWAQYSTAYLYGILKS